MPQPRAEVRVATWNLLTETATHHAPWAERVPAVAAYLTELQPTVLGTQEGSRAMLDDLVGRLPAGYRWVGEGRRGRGEDEHAAVVYDASALTVLDVRNRWLSATPEAPGSMAADADLPRMLTAVRFHHAGSGTVFEVLNTHLDHLGVQARVEAAVVVAAQIAAVPTVVLGDFNDEAGTSDAYRVLTSSGLVDAVAPARQRSTFLDAPVGRIDWVLVTPDVPVVDAWVDDAPAGASDHRPVVADLVLPVSEPRTTGSRPG